MRVLLVDILAAGVLVGLYPADVLAPPETPLPEAVPPCVQPLRAAAPARAKRHGWSYGNIQSFVDLFQCYGWGHGQSQSVLGFRQGLEEESGDNEELHFVEGRK